DDGAPRPPHYRYLEVAETRGQMVAHVSLEVGDSAINHTVVYVLQHLAVDHGVYVYGLSRYVDFHRGYLGMDRMDAPHQNDEGEEGDFTGVVHFVVILK